MGHILGGAGEVHINGRVFVLPQQTPSDVSRVYDAMRDIAARGCMNPIAYVNAVAPTLTPMVLAEAMRAAVAMGAGGGPEPTRESVMRAYDSLDGIRFQFWFFARKTDPTLTREAVKELVTEDNVYDVADALVKSQQLPGDPLGKAPGSSPSGS